ncbi:amidophosphoribosyltransferase [Ruminococcaceae bacterium YAD3003]|nr:amidophosphoribosyltransferase [Ruminococcaceae bacterium YAD3003]
MSGVFGCYDIKGSKQDVTRDTYYGIFSLQHRGQESCGIAVNDDGTFLVHKAPGLVTDVFDEVTLSALAGTCAIGHARGGSPRESGTDAIQPISIKSRVGNIALTSDSVIMNANKIRDGLKDQGAIFQTNTDSEIILSLFSRNRIRTEDCEHAILETMKEIHGVYAMIFMTEDKLIGVRDPYGLRPLILGKLGDKYYISSESCALDAIGCETIRDFLPGEIITISKDGMSSMQYDPATEKKDGKVCVFEYVYVARPDSVIDQMSIFDSRYRVGMALAKESPADVDLVIGAPDSGNAAAEGYAAGLGVAYGAGLLKNRYVGRTFIKSTQQQRELAVRMKFAALKTAIKGKRIAIVDDSLVRGTTTKHIISFLRENGAAEVHVRLASPPVKFGCCYGVNASSETELPASTKTIEEIRDMIGADSLAYISLDSLRASLNTIDCGVCSACFDGDFIAGKPEDDEESIHKVKYN